MYWSVFCPPLSLSPSECMHWSISISHGAFRANPAGRLIKQLGREVHTGGEPPLGTVLQQLDWALNLRIVDLIHTHYSIFCFPQKVTNTCQPLFFSKSRLMLVPSIKSL